MCLWHRIYKWISDLPLGKPVSVPPDIKDEIFSVTLAMAVCASPIRWQVSRFIRATDAPASPGGTVGGMSARSDTGLIADALFLPYWFWGGLITLTILAMVWLSLRFASRY